MEVRRAGQKSLYRLSSAPGALTAFWPRCCGAAQRKFREAANDDAGLHLALERRKDKLRGYFDDLAGRFGRNYVPGRSWKALAEMLLRLLPPLVIADLGRR